VIDKFFTLSPTDLTDAQRALLLVSALRSHLRNGSFTSKTLGPALAKAYPFLTGEQVQAGESILKLVFENPAFKRSTRTAQTSIETWLRLEANAAGTIFSADFREKKMDQLISEAQAMESALGVRLFSVPQETLLKRARYDKSRWQVDDMDWVLGGAVTQLISRLFLFQAMTAPEVIAKVKGSKFEFTTLQKLLDWEGRRANYETILKSEKSWLENHQYYENICRTGVTQVLASVPSALRHRKDREIFTQVKVAALQTAPQYFRGEALDAAMTAIENVEISRLQNLDLIESGLEARFFQLSLIEGAEERRLSSALRSQMGIPANAILSLADHALDSTFDTASTIGGSCLNLHPPSFNDFALGTGLINLSWQTAVFPEIGASVVAHELGHTASFAAQGKPGAEIYSEVRACTQDMHSVLDGPSANATSAEDYQEEDWADAFSISVVRNLRKTWPYAKSFGCSLLPIDADGTEYAGEGLSLSGVDSHSAAILRAIEAHVGLGGKLPASCVNAVGPKAAARLATPCTR
jgi:hypothetical protein